MTEVDRVAPARPQPEKYVADRLLRLRNDHRYTQDEIALLVGQPRPIVSDWERSKRKPSTRDLAVLARVYDDDWLRGFVAARANP